MQEALSGFTEEFEGGKRKEYLTIHAVDCIVPPEKPTAAEVGKVALSIIPYALNYTY